MSEDPSKSQWVESAMNRRVFVRTAGAAGAVGVAASTVGGVTGCAANGSAASGPGNDSRQQGADGTQAAVADPAATGPSLLGPVADIAVGGGKVFASPPLVVTHPAAGQFKAFSGTCTHSGCKLSAVKDGDIICPCHGCRFSAATGAVLRGPATVALPAVPITVVNGIARVA